MVIGTTKRGPDLRRSQSAPNLSSTASPELGGTRESQREALRGMGYEEQRRQLSPKPQAREDGRLFELQRRYHVQLDQLDGLVNELEARVDELGGQDDIAAFPDFGGQRAGFGATAAAFHGKVDELRGEQPETAADMAALLAELAGPFGAFSQVATPHAYAAKAAGEPGIARGIIRVADTAHQRATELHATRLPTGDDAVQSHGHDRLGDGVGKVDAGQTALGGLGGGVLGAVDLGQQVGAGADKVGVITNGIGLGAMAAIGYTTGAVGALFGAIGLGLGIRAIVRGSKKEKELAALIPTLDSGAARSIAEYARSQKKKKKTSGKITAIASATAMGAGILGMIAVSVTTLGVGAVVLGVGAALIGLGVGIYKWVHRSRKRRRERDQLAQSIMTAESTGDGDALAGLPPQTIALAHTANQSQRDKDFHALSEALKGVAQSRREEAADSALGLLVTGGPADRFDAELVVEALGLKPDQLRGYVAEGKTNTARDRIMRKMKSW